MGGGAGMNAHANAVVFATDATYLPIAWTAAKTAATQAGRNFDVLLLTAPGLTRGIPAPPGCTMREVELPAALRDLPGPTHMSPFTYARLAIADLWAPGYERLLYIDADTRIIGPLAPLFGLDLRGNTVGMVEDCGRYLRDATAKPGWDDYRASLGLDTAKPYYNAGVLLIDSAAWRAENCWRRLLEFITAREGKLIFMDQDALNVVCAGRIAQFSPRWNFVTHYLGLGVEATVEPRILHYADILKPWRDPEWRHLHGDEAPQAFARLLADSPWPGLMPTGWWRRWQVRYRRRITRGDVRSHLRHFTAIAERLRREIPPGLAATAPHCVDLGPEEIRAWQAAFSPA
jgi:hypothetical protein